MSAVRAGFRMRRDGFTLDVNLQLPERGITALFGPSGCGKTTLLRAIAGLGRCEGYISFGDAVWQNDTDGSWLSVERRPLGYVFQEASLFPHLSVRDNLEYGYRRLAAGRRRIAIDDVTAWLGLSRLLGRKPAALSGGERQRAAIGRALLVSPELLLMDEPLSALDRASKAEIMPYLERLHRELSIPVVYVTHALDEVARLADYIVQMEAGRVVARGPAMTLLASLSMRPVAGEEPGAVIEARLAGHDMDHHLSHLLLPEGCELLAPLLSVDDGALVRVRVPAREVSIALAPPEGVSILNILPARIVDFREGDPGRLLVQLALEGEAGMEGQTRLLSRISRYSWERLQLEPGKRVQAQIKSMGLV